MCSSQPLIPKDASSGDEEIGREEEVLQCVVDPRKEDDVDEKTANKESCRDMMFKTQIGRRE